LRYLYCCVEYVYTLLLYRKKHPTDASFISSPCVYNNSTSCYLTSVCMLSIFFTKKNWRNNCIEHSILANRRRWVH
jgi:hypothetical protein